IEQFTRLEHGIDDPGDHGAIVHALQYRLQQGRFSRPDFPRHDDEPGPAFDAVSNRIERLAVGPAEKQVLRIRAQCEWALAKVIKAFVHYFPHSVVLHGARQIERTPQWSPPAWLDDDESGQSVPRRREEPRGAAPASPASWRYPAWSRRSGAIRLWRTLRRDVPAPAT